MATLPANSTFLPVLDDLLSPDFRPTNIPGQTPQTPAETPLSATVGRSMVFGESHTGQLTGKVTFQSVLDLGTERERQGHYSLLSNGMRGKGSGVEEERVSVKFQTDPQPQSSNHAALKIQKWWKSRKGKARMGNGTVDPRVERAKHSIRHSRTEEHVRFLETEVHRLKSALTTERKLRSLQLEAIRSLWSQVQKVSSVQSSASGDNNIMTQSMPNGLADKKSHDSNGMMSASFHSASESIQPSPQKLTELTTSCTCTKEIQNLKESLSGEMFQLRKMIDQLRVEKKDETTIKAAVDDSSKSFLQKRPLTLNLTGTSGKESSQQGNEEVSQSKKEITGYADQMASSIIEDLKETDEKD